MKILATIGALLLVVLLSLAPLHRDARVEKYAHSGRRKVYITDMHYLFV